MPEQRFHSFQPLCLRRQDDALPLGGLRPRLQLVERLSECLKLTE